MIEVYADCSYDNADDTADILAVGYFVYRVQGIERDLVTTGTRVFNTEHHEREIDWCSGRGEYYALIVATRAALGYTDEAIRLHTDCQTIIDVLGKDEYVFEPYFQHALFSFLGRFEEYVIEVIEREDNELAHEQARNALEIGRRVQKGVV
jgi:hypothetical protein